EILARYMAGEQIADMAPGYGYSDVSLYALLLREHEETWKHVQAARAIARMERSLIAIDKATDLIGLAREREKLKSSMWELERGLRRVYGNEHAAPPAQVIINVGIDRDRPAKIPFVGRAKMDDPETDTEGAADAQLG